MGQVQSQETSSASPPTAAALDAHHTQSTQSSAAPHNSQSASSMDSLIAEAVAYSSDENESLDAKAQKALECPCMADLRNGPCGDQFSEAFVCFLKSTAEEKGSDCVHPFVALQNCIKANPNAFSKDILEDNEVRKEEESEEYKIIPPIWSKEPQSPKTKAKL